MDANAGELMYLLAMFQIFEMSASEADRLRSWKLRSIAAKQAGDLSAKARQKVARSFGAYFIQIRYSTPHVTMPSSEMFRYGKAQ